MCSKPYLKIIFVIFQMNSHNFKQTNTFNKSILQKMPPMSQNVIYTL